MRISEEQKVILIEFLQWNDRNGGYEDLTRNEAIRYFFDVVNPDFLAEEDDGNPLGYTLKEIIQIAKKKNVYKRTIFLMNILFADNSLKTYRILINRS